MGLIQWLGSVFNTNKEEIKALPSPISIYTAVKRDIPSEIIKESQVALKKLNDLVELSDGSIYYDTMLEIFKTSSKIHDRIISDDNIPIQKLRSFTKYKTLEFVNTFDSLLYPLKPIVEIPEHLKSDFRLDEDIEIEIEEKEVIKEKVVPITKFDTSINNIKVFLESHGISKIVNEKYSKDIITTLKVLLSYSIYEYIKNTPSINYNIKSNKEVNINDSQLIESYISFLAKNSSIKQKTTIYVATSSNNNDSPVLFDLSSNEVYLYSYLTKESVNRFKIDNDYITDISQLIKYNNYNL